MCSGPKRCRSTRSSARPESWTRGLRYPSGEDRSCRAILTVPERNRNLIGYARYSTDEQDRTTQQQIVVGLEPTGSISPTG